MSLQNPEPTSQVRREVYDKPQIEKYFKSLEAVMRKHGSNNDLQHG